MTLLLLLLSCEPPPPHAGQKDIPAESLWVEGVGGFYRWTDPQTHAICYGMRFDPVPSCVCPDDGCRAVE